MVAINGVPITGFDMSEIVASIVGKEGTFVRYVYLGLGRGVLPGFGGCERDVRYMSPKGPGTKAETILLWSVRLCAMECASIDSTETLT